MTAPMDWAAFSEADEESRQALLRRAIKIEPSLQVALTTPTKKVRYCHQRSCEVLIQGQNGLRIVPETFDISSQFPPERL